MHLDAARSLRRAPRWRRRSCAAACAALAGAARQPGGTPSRGAWRRGRCRRRRRARLWRSTALSTGDSVSKVSPRAGVVLAVDQVRQHSAVAEAARDRPPPSRDQLVEVAAAAITRPVPASARLWCCGGTSICCDLGGPRPSMPMGSSRQHLRRSDSRDRLVDRLCRAPRARLGSRPYPMRIIAWMNMRFGLPSATR